MSNPGGTHPILTFRLGGELYGIPIALVREVVRFVKITAVPRSPAYMPGIMNLRGGVVTVVDLAGRFSLSSLVEAEQAFIIVLELPAGEGRANLLGLRVDVVEEVFELDRDAVQEAPRIGTVVASDFITGIGKKEEEFITLLDLPKVFLGDFSFADTAVEPAEPR